MIQKQYFEKDHWKPIFKLARQVVAKASKKRMQSGKADRSSPRVQTIQKTVAGSSRAHINEIQNILKWKKKVNILICGMMNIDVDIRWIILHP